MVLSTLEVVDKNLTSYRLYINDQLIEDKNCNGKVITNISKGKIDFWLNPKNQNWGIKPIIRINNFLLNTYLANITLYDHMFSFEFNDSFYENYKNKNLTSIQDAVPANKKNDHLYIDKHFGIDNFNENLVYEIKTILNEKYNSNISSKNR